MQLNNIEVRRYDMISVAFPAGSNATKLTFPDQPQLRGAKVHAIDLVYTNIDINGIPNANYLTSVLGVYNISNIFLTLYFNGMEGIQNMPLGEIAHIQGSNLVIGGSVAQNNNNGILGLNGQVITWTKSYLQLAVPAPQPVNSVFVLGVYYTL
jgi:hypothetical protein